MAAQALRSEFPRPGPEATQVSRTDDRIRPLVELFEEPGEVLGAMLTVAINTHDALITLRLRPPETRPHGAADTEPDAQMQTVYSQAGKKVCRAIVRGVVDDEDLAAWGRATKIVDYEREALDLVVHGHDDQRHDREVYPRSPMLSSGRPRRPVRRRQPHARMAAAHAMSRSRCTGAK